MKKITMIFTAILTVASFAMAEEMAAPAPTAGSEMAAPAADTGAPVKKEAKKEKKKKKKGQKH